MICWKLQGRSLCTRSSPVSHVAHGCHQTQEAPLTMMSAVLPTAASCTTLDRQPSEPCQNPSAAAYSASSPRYKHLSLDPEATMGWVGWNVASFTAPWCPGSLYSRLRLLASQMLTILSALPDATCTADRADDSGNTKQLQASMHPLVSVLVHHC